MIYAYDVSLPGAYHVKNKIPNQDCCKIEKFSKELVIAAVADGLGSAIHSDVASKIAVEESVMYCKGNVKQKMRAMELLAVIKESFSIAYNKIEKRAKLEKHDITGYDTTLTLVIVVGDKLFYGHSGDSGIVVLTAEGQYQKVTEQQRDENSCVFPLFFKDKWVFGEYDENVCSVFLATDGILETLFPFYIRNEEVNIYVTLAEYFMDNRRLQIEKRGEGVVKKEVENFIDGIPEEQVDDDKTVVVLVNTSIKPKIMPDEYYKEPDWVALKQKHDEEWRREAYPHLYADNNADNQKEKPTVTESNSTLHNDVDNFNADQESRSNDNADVSSVAKKSKELLENARTIGIDLINKGINEAERIIDNIVSSDENK